MVVYLNWPLSKTMFQLIFDLQFSNDSWHRYQPTASIYGVKLVRKRSEVRWSRLERKVAKLIGQRIRVLTILHATFEWLNYLEKQIDLEEVNSVLVNRCYLELEFRFKCSLRFGGVHAIGICSPKGRNGALRPVSRITYNSR